MHIYNFFQKKVNMTKLGKKVRYDPSRIVGNGSYASVYEGLYENTKKVVVKRILRGQVDEMLLKEEVYIMLKADDHPNILRCLCCEMNDDFLYVIILFFNFNYRCNITVKFITTLVRKRLFRIKISQKE